MNKEQVIKVLGDDEIRDFIIRKDYEIFKLLQRIDKTIELLEKEKSPCPMSLTLEKAYIIEVEKINKVISILRGEEDE